MMSPNPHRPKLYLLAALTLCGGISYFQSYLNPYYYQIIIYIGINIILASSLNIINGLAGQFSLGHAGFMAIGAYASSVISTSLNLPPGSLWEPFLFLGALIFGGIMASLCGLLVGVPCLRLRGDYLAITTLGFGEIIRVIIQNLDFLGAARGFSGITKVSNFFWVYGLVSILIFLIYGLLNSTYGKGFLAVRDDEVAAEAIGINTTYYKVVAFVTGAFFAGIAGGLYAHFVTYINPSQFGFIKSFEIVVMVVVGGMGSIVGVIISAVLLTILPEALRAMAQYRMVIYSLLLIVIMLSRPQGLFGGHINWRRFRRNTGSRV